MNQSHSDHKVGDPPFKAKEKVQASNNNLLLHDCVVPKALDGMNKSHSDHKVGDPPFKANRKL